MAPKRIFLDESLPPPGIWMFVMVIGLVDTMIQEVTAGIQWHTDQNETPVPAVHLLNTLLTMLRRCQRWLSEALEKITEWIEDGGGDKGDKGDKGGKGGKGCKGGGNDNSNNNASFTCKRLRGS